MKTVMLRMPHELHCGLGLLEQFHGGFAIAGRLLRIKADPRDRGRHSLGLPECNERIEVNGHVIEGEEVLSTDGITRNLSLAPDFNPTVSHTGGIL